MTEHFVSVITVMQELFDLIIPSISDTTYNCEPGCKSKFDLIIPSISDTTFTSDNCEAGCKSYLI